jgi:hypothetical protein
MGLEKIDVTQNMLHQKLRSLNGAIKSFKNTALLYTVVEAQDPLGIEPAIHTFLDTLVARMTAYCRKHEPSQMNLDRNTPHSAFSGMTSTNAVEEWEPASEIVRVDERNISEFAARYLFGNLHKYLFPDLPTRNDLLTADKISGLAWLKPSHLGVNAALMSLTQVEQAQKLLRRLCRQRSPGEMLAALAQAFRKVTEAAALTAQLHAAAQSRRESAFGADELTPLFIMVVLRANPPMFSSVLAYTECLITSGQRMTEQGYALTLLRAAVSFTDHVGPDQLIGLAPGEWERYMGQRR